MVLSEGGRGVDLASLIDALSERGWLEVMVEGGAELATSLLREDLVDRLEVHHGPLVVGRGGPEIGDLGIDTMSDARTWTLARSRAAGDTVISVYDRRRA